MDKLKNMIGGGGQAPAPAGAVENPDKVSAMTSHFFGIESKRPLLDCGRGRLSLREGTDRVPSSGRPPHHPRSYHHPALRPADSTHRPELRHFGKDWQV